MMTLVQLAFLTFVGGMTVLIAVLCAIDIYNKHNEWQKTKNRFGKSK